MIGSPVDREALEEERDLLLASLRDLEREHEAGDVDDHDYQALRDGYTVRAASILRTLETDDRRVSTDPPTRDRPPITGIGSGGPLARSSPTGRVRSSPGAGKSRTGAITAIVVVAVLAVAGAGVVLSSGQREPGQPITGSLPDSGSGAPDGGRIAEAIELDRQGQAVAALQVYDEILAADPDNPDALAYRGWLLKRVSGGVEDPAERQKLIDEAMVALDRAVTVAPAYPDAHFFRGMVLLQDRGDPAGAVREFEAFMASDPPAAMVPSVQAVLDEARAAAAAAGG